MLVMVIVMTEVGWWSWSGVFRYVKPKQSLQADRGVSTVLPSSTAADVNPEEAVSHQGQAVVGGAQVQTLAVRLQGLPFKDITVLQNTFIERKVLAFIRLTFKLCRLD